MCTFNDHFPKKRDSNYSIFIKLYCLREILRFYFLKTTVNGKTSDDRLMKYLVVYDVCPSTNGGCFLINFLAVGYSRRCNRVRNIYLKFTEITQFYLYFISFTLSNIL